MLPKGAELAIWSSGADLIDNEENSNDDEVKKIIIKHKLYGHESEIS